MRRRWRRRPGRARRPPEPAPAPAPARARGFTLLEALIAFAIASGALAVLFQSGAAALRAAGEAARAEAAMSRAQSHLAEAASSLSGDNERIESGTDGAYRWRVAIRRIDKTVARRHADPAGTVANTLRLYRIEVTESWTEGPHTRELRLGTDRLSADPPHPE